MCQNGVCATMREATKNIFNCKTCKRKFFSSEALFHHQKDVSLHSFVVFVVMYFPQKRIAKAIKNLFMIVTNIFVIHLFATIVNRRHYLLGVASREASASASDLRVPRR